jgi:hypothetical protein
MHAAPSDKFAVRNSNPCIGTIHTNFHPVKTPLRKFLSTFYSLSFLQIHETRLLNTDTWVAFGGPENLKTSSAGPQLRSPLRAKADWPISLGTSLALGTPKLRHAILEWDESRTRSLYRFEIHWVDRNGLSTKPLRAKIPRHSTFVIYIPTVRL